MTYIVLIKNGDDSGHVVQHAQNKKQARTLIDKVLPKTKEGYSYKII